MGLGHPQAVGSQQQQLCGIRVVFDAGIKKWSTLQSHNSLLDVTDALNLSPPGPTHFSIRLLTAAERGSPLRAIEEPSDPYAHCSMSSYWGHGAFLESV